MNNGYKRIGINIFYIIIAEGSLFAFMILVTTVTNSEILRVSKVPDF